MRLEKHWICLYKTYFHCNKRRESISMRLPNDNVPTLTVGTISMLSIVRPVRLPYTSMEIADFRLLTRQSTLASAGSRDTSSPHLRVGHGHQQALCCRPVASR